MICCKDTDSLPILYFVWCFCGVLLGAFVVFRWVFLWYFVGRFCGVLLGVFAVVRNNSA